MKEWGDSWESQRIPFNPNTAAAATPAPARPTTSETGSELQHYGKPLTKQYGKPEETKKTNLTFQEQVKKEKVASDSESDVDPEIPSDLEQLKAAIMAQCRANILKAKLVPTINDHVDYITRKIGLVQGNDSHFIAVTDNGADTTAMGDGWLILGDTERAPGANLVSFDKDAKKKGLPIVSGVIKVRLEDDSFIILRVHQGVYNSGSRTTLISEFQVRNHGLILDSVSSQHRAHADGDKGTQTFWLSADQKLPLKLKGGLMTFVFSTPS